MPHAGQIILKEYIGSVFLILRSTPSGNHLSISSIQTSGLSYHQMRVRLRVRVDSNRVFVVLLVVAKEFPTRALLVLFCFCHCCWRHFGEELFSCSRYG